MSDVPFQASDVEYETGTIVMPNGSFVCLPKSEIGQDFTMACVRAAVDARREWHRPAS